MGRQDTIPVYRESATEYYGRIHSSMRVQLFMVKRWVVEHIPQILVLMIVMFAISCVLHTLRTGGYHPQSSKAKPSASRRMLASTEPKNDGGDPFPKMGYLLIFGM